MLNKINDKNLMPVGIIVMIVLESIDMYKYSSSEDDESCSRQEILGSVKQINNCHVAAMVLGS